MIVYFDLQVWIARLGEEKKKKNTTHWHFLQPSAWLLHSAELSHKSDHQEGLYLHGSLRRNLLTFKHRKCLFYYSKFCTTFKRSGGAARRLWARGKQHKEADNLHGETNIPAPARGEETEIYNGAGLPFFCLLSARLQAFRVACCSLLGATGERLLRVQREKPVQTDF